MLWVAEGKVNASWKGILDLKCSKGASDLMIRRIEKYASRMNGKKNPLPRKKEWVLES
jgi:hypothetical protein